MALGNDQVIKASVARLSALVNIGNFFNVDVGYILVRYLDYVGGKFLTTNHRRGYGTQTRVSGMGKAEGAQQNLERAQNELVLQRDDWRPCTLP